MFNEKYRVRACALNHSLHFLINPYMFSPLIPNSFNSRFDGFIMYKSVIIIKEIPGGYAYFFV